MESKSSEWLAFHNYHPICLRRIYAFGQRVSTPSGGAGSEINNMLNGWSATAGAGVTRDDYAALTMDQLKTAVKPFYDRLAVLYARVPGSYPWSAVGSSAEDYALANLGQLKTAFSFDIAIPDTNLNGFPDLREIQMFGNLNQSAGADPDLL